MDKRATAWILVTGSLLLAGCQGDEVNPLVKREESSAPVESVGPPNELVKTDLAIFRESGRLQIGDTWDTAIELFRPVKNSYEFSDLPPRFTSPMYKARGWDARREGFGALLYKGRIAFAMYQLAKAEPNQFNDFVELHERQLRRHSVEKIDGKRAQYRFWQVDKQRLMILGLETKGVTKITIALGDEVVMKALGISPEDARREIQRIDDSPEPEAPPSKTSSSTFKS